MIRLGSKWSSVDLDFVVTGLVEKQDGVWVYYKNLKTEQEYNCLIEAFKLRFREVTNDSYGKI